MPCMYKEKIALWEWYDVPVVNSTNDEIKKFLFEETPVVISAVRQTKGRGRRGHTWQEKEGNLYFTLSLKIPPFELSRYVCLIGLRLAKTIKALSPESNVKIKWPNDVFLNNKKVSGILLEKLKEDIWAIGIGVNIVASPTICNMPYQAGSLKESAIVLDRTDFLRYYLENFAKDLLLYQKEGFLPIKAQWLSFAMNLNREITIKNERTVQTGIFLTLDDNGYLLLKTDEQIKRIVAGDLFVQKE